MDRAPLRNIAERFAISATALHGHKVRDLSNLLVREAETQEMAHGRDSLERVRGFVESGHGILAAAEARGDRRTVLAAFREVRGTLEVLGKITGQLTHALPEQAHSRLFNLPPGSHVALAYKVPDVHSAQVKSGS